MARGDSGRIGKINAAGNSEPAGAGLLPVYLIVFSAFFDTHAQMPVLAPYAVSMGATPFILGVVIGTYSFFNILGNFTGGAAIDRKGWKVPLIIGLLGVSFALLIYTQVDVVLYLVLTRGAHGFMGGLLVPAALACLTGNKDGSAFYGPRLAVFGATIGLAAVTGPLAAGIIATNFGYPAVYYSLSALMFTATIASAAVAKKQVVCSRPAAPVSFRQISALPEMRGAFIFALGTMGSTGTLASFLPARAESLGFDPAQTGMLFATFALVAIVVQIFWPGKLKPVLGGNCRGCTVGLFFLCLGLSLAASLNNATGLFAALATFGIGFGLTFQGMLGMVIDGSELSWRGRAIGLFFAVYSFGVAVVPPLSGLIWQNLPAIFPFYTAAAVALASMACGLKIARQ